MTDLPDLVPLDEAQDAILSPNMLPTRAREITIDAVEAFFKSIVEKKPYHFVVSSFSCHH